MKRIQVSDCVSTQFMSVVGDSCPVDSSKKTVFAVFDTLTETGFFRGLVTQHDIAMHRNWTFAELAGHRHQAKIRLETAAEIALAVMEKEDLDTLPALDEKNKVVGVVTQSDLLLSLYQHERASLLKAQQQNRRHTLARLELLAQMSTAKARISHMEDYDVLTGYPNVALIQKKIEREIQRQLANKSCAVLALDLDDFRSVKDRMGNFFSDLILKQISVRIAGNLGNNAMLARNSGDGFIIVLSQIVFPQDAVGVAKIILNALTVPFMINAQSIYITASMGISLYPQDGLNAEMLLTRAGIALSQAKHRGKNTYQFFTEAMMNTVQALEKQESRLREVLKRHELLVYYQPMVESKHKRVIAMEALLRWNSPEHGLMLPAHFLPLAEQLKLILPIDAWVLRTACKQMKQWQDLDKPRHVAVNLSALHFECSSKKEQNQLIRYVERGLEEANLAPEFLELEITETILIKNYDVAMAILKKLKNLGVRIACDDFGTGYSSLNYLKKFPIDTIKIDQSFVNDMVNSPVDLAIVRSIIFIAEQLSIQVIAEGVETREQLLLLQNLGCDIIQGFCFSKPLPADEMSELLKRGF